MRSPARRYRFAGDLRVLVHNDNQSASAAGLNGGQSDTTVTLALRTG
jgi:hypothetical protein